MSKVILLEPEIDPPFEFLVQEGRSYRNLPSLWALSIGTYLKKNIPTTKITILDCRFFVTEELVKWAKKIKPNFVGISPKFISYKNTLKASRIFKKFGAKVVLGGMHASALKREILTNRGPDSDDYCVDVIVKEDGEKAFCEYVASKPLSKINNLIWWDGKIKAVRENKTELLNLDSLPIADRDSVNVEQYFVKGGALTICSQKGCIWREKSGGCIFCAQPVSGLRFRDPVEVWKEIDFLKKKYGIQLIWDSTENFLNSLEWVKEFWQISKKYKNKPQFKIFARLDLVDEKIAKMLRGINVVETILGVESGSQQALLTIRKGITPRLIKKKIQLLHKYGVKTFHCYVLGAPGENISTLKETLKFAKELAKTPGHCGSRFNSLVPFPGSPAWKMLLEKTGTQYVSKDLIEWNEVVEDWISNFCNIDISRFGKILQKARQFSKEATKISYDKP